MYRLFLIAAIAFLGRYAVRSLGTVRTTAILSRLFWVLYAAWCALVLYLGVRQPMDWKTAGLLLVAPLLLGCVVVFIATGRCPVIVLRALRFGYIGLVLILLAFLIVLRVAWAFPLSLMIQLVYYEHSASGKLGGVGFFAWLAAPLLEFIRRIRYGSVVER
jgi:hypothetical protein